ncbi:retrotransposon protein [Striga asiatica]|uniref:Retrotransposon protein n=1 Tax=Striga asiatica TaxID=4170 RepID=A0A5A7R075_STRAF|nr:retrotransposon protein [Striga asiatica]
MLHQRRNRGLPHKLLSTLFTSEGSVDIGNLISYIPTTITEAQNETLVAQVTEEEIRNALLSMHPDKALGWDAVTSFFNTGHILKNWNLTLITLIPKCQVPLNVGDYRPISLCEPCLPLCISNTQAAFIPDRQLLDNVIIAQEVFHFLNRHRTGTKRYMALKLDMSKAFDRIEWGSIKSLSCLIQHEMAIGSYKGLKISRQGPILSHLFFADDSLLFCQATADSANLILEMLEKYKSFTGQQVNMVKSSVFFSKNTLEDVQRNIGHILQGITVSKGETFKYLVDAVKSRLLSWKNKFLSGAVHPIFTMSCFLLPVGLCKELSQLFAQFWWCSQSANKTGIHWKAWKLLTLPKAAGSLNFHDLQVFNEALILKQIWRLITKPGLLMSRVLRHRYFPTGDFFGAKPNQNASWLWRSWLKLQKKFLQGFMMQVRDGRKTKIWEQPWVPNLSNYKLLNKSSTTPSLTWVSELIAEHGVSWKEDLLRRCFSHSECQAILQINTLSRHLQDKATWSFNPRQVFTVASTYAHLIYNKILQLDIPENSTNAVNLRKMRNRSWKLKIKGKVKHFIWKCYSGILPVATTLYKRELKQSGDCHLFIGKGRLNSITTSHTGGQTFA